MTKEFLLDLIRQGESQTVEFKESLTNPKDFASVLVSFANANDGYIILGVSNSKGVKGIRWTNKEEEWLLNVGTNNCQPPIVPLVEKVDLEKRKVVVLTVLEGTDKPYKANNICYIRIGQTTRPTDRQTEIRLMQEVGHLSFERLPVKNGLFEDLDSIKIKEYLNVRAPYLKDASLDKTKQILINLDFLTNGIGRIVPTYAGILCLGSFPQKFLPQAVIKAAFFKGRKKEHIILDRSLLEGTLLDLINQGENFVKKNMRIARVSREDRKIDLPQYSLKAVREALANALIHRDYTIEGREVMFLFFEDRLEIENPGGLGGGLEKKDLGKRRWSRNPILTRYLYEMGQVEGLGRGIQMMREEARLLNAPLPQFESDKESFRVIFRPAAIEKDN